MGEMILGMPGPWAEDCREQSNHYTTKIGGLPDWPTEDMDVGLDVLNCGLCGEKLCLFAQVYAPISVPKLNIEERVIYFFGCQVPECASSPRSWRAIRVQKCLDEKQNYSTCKEMALKEDPAPASTSNNFFAEDLLSFGGSNDGSDDDIDLEELSQAFAEAGAQTPHSKRQNFATLSKDFRNVIPPKLRLVDVDTQKSVLPCFYICSEKAQTPSNISSICASYSSLSVKGVDSTKDHDEEESWEGENYEYDRAIGADRTYLKFKKQLDLYPEQCFRYSYSGKPLLATSDVIEPDACRICGSSRQYEMQLMSPLLYFLHEAANGSSTFVPEEWSWITLILYTCSTSCCPSSCNKNSGSCSWAVAEEAIIVQGD